MGVLFTHFRIFHRIKKLLLLTIPTPKPEEHETLVLHCPKCKTIANLHYIGKNCIGCDNCVTDKTVIQCPECNAIGGPPDYGHKHWCSNKTYPYN